MNEKKIILLVYVSSLILLVSLNCAIFLAPYLKYISSKWHIYLYSFFAPLCHQIPSRCFFIFGHPLAVCARCLGIYLGFLIGLLICPLWRSLFLLTLPGKKIFVAFSLPVLIDVLGNFLHFWESSKLIRCSLGFIWGILLPFYFIKGLAEVFLEISKKFPLKLKLKNK